MKTKKISIVLALIICGTLALLAQTSGTCGSNLKWSYNSSSKTLIITGSGSLPDYGYSSTIHKHTMPWEPFLEEIENISLPDGLTRIGAYAFYDCKNLSSISIPNSVTSIGSWAFSGCTSLTEASVPTSVTEMESGAFWDVPNIIYYGSAYGAPRDARCQNGYIDGFLVYSDASKKILKACSSKANGAITIPSSVITIDKEAFEYCSKITSISIPNSVQVIGSRAFSSCRGLTSINIPNSVTTIGDKAFTYCRNLETISIANSNINLGKDVFEKCDKLKYIYCNKNINLSEVMAPTTTQRMAYNPSNASTSSSVANTLTTHQNELRSDLINFLKEEGFMPEIDSDGDILFKREGVKWYISINSVDEMPMYVSLFKWYNYSENFSKEAVSATLADLNSYKGVKVVIGNNGFMPSAEMYVVNAEPLKYAFYKLLGQIDNMDNRLTILIDEVKSLTFQSAFIANVDSDDSIIDDYGRPLYNYRAKYLKFKVFADVITSGNYTFYVKIYNPDGRLLTDAYSPTGYTYKNSIKLEKGRREMHMIKWGTSTTGFWKSGKYKAEFYVNDKKIGEKEFSIYGN